AGLSVGEAMMRFLLISTVMLALSESLAAQPAPVPGSTPAPLGSHMQIQPVGDVDPVKHFTERMKQLRMKADLAGLLNQSNDGRGFDLNQLKRMLEENPQLRD